MENIVFVNKGHGVTQSVSNTVNDNEVPLLGRGVFSVHSYQSMSGETLRYGRLSDPLRTQPAKQGLVFVPGMGGSVKGALSFLALLLEEYDPIYGIDLHGFGLNSLPTQAIQLNQILYGVEGFKQFFLQQHQGQEFALAGISLGAVISTHWAVSDPSRFSSLLLMAPAFRPSRISFTWPYTLKAVYGRIRHGKHYEVSLPYTIMDLTKNPAIREDEHFQLKPPLCLTADFLLAVDLLCIQALQKVKRLSLPTMMVIPEKDKVCDPGAMRKAFARLSPEIQTHCLDYPGLYHDVLMECEHPEIAQSYLNWLSSLNE